MLRKLYLIISLVLCLYTSAPAYENNVIWIVVDTLRADHLSCFNYGRDTTPNIDAFAQNAFFKNAYAPAPWTLPSFASMLTARHSFNHDYNQPMNYLTGAPPQDGLVKLMKGDGYDTISIQTNYFLRILDQDFAEAHHLCEFSTSPKLDEIAVKKAMEWLSGREEDEGKYFLFLGLIGPHWPYFYQNDAFEQFAKDPLFHTSKKELVPFKSSMADDLITYEALPRGLRNLMGDPDEQGHYRDSRLYVSAYDADIKQTDSYLGTLLDFLKTKGLYDTSLIIITADHGESLTEVHPYFGHGQALHNCLIHVPLFIKFPNQRAKFTIHSNVSTIDIFPTILDYLDIRHEQQIDGMSLMTFLFDDFLASSNPFSISGKSSILRNRPVFSYREPVGDGTGAEFCVIYQKEKLIMSDEDNYFNLSSDPDESCDLASKKTGRVAFLKKLLEKEIVEE